MSILKIQLFEYIWCAYSVKLWFGSILNPLTLFDTTIIFIIIERHMAEQQQSAAEEKGNYIEIKLSVPQLPRRNSDCGLIPGQFLSSQIYGRKMSSSQK